MWTWWQFALAALLSPPSLYLLFLGVSEWRAEREMRRVQDIRRSR